MSFTTDTQRAVPQEAVQGLAHDLGLPASVPMPAAVAVGTVVHEITVRKAAIEDAAPRIARTDAKKSQ